ncbi:MAG TPA: ABC transporter ATP-binding protein [Fastidiosipila sp.]|nr:ABC transporter ATP-binding protein [Fastidiosipila sp.]
MKSLLEVKNADVFYGPIHALKGISLDVAEGSVVALLGANGAGKSTTLRAVTGLVRSRSGEIIYDGRRIDRMAEEKIARIGISHVPEGRQIFASLTTLENLMIGAYSVHDKREIDANLERCYGYFPILAERKHQLAQTLSGGEQQMLAIARGLMSSPKLLLLDEPSLGLAPLIVKSIMDIIKTIAKEGVTILIVEQNASQTLKIADYAYVLEVGRIIASGDAATLASDPALVEAYLGGKGKPIT